MRYFEDVRVGETHVPGSHTVGEAEILAFARKYDPQPFHIDTEAAKASIFGGLIASGWHTCAITMRLSVDAAQRQRAAITGSPGIDSCRWLKPVRAGDTLTARAEVLETRPSRTRPIGFVRSRTEVLNQRGEVVLTLVGIAMYRRREEGAA
jgi:acyl dehydratase